MYNLQPDIMEKIEPIVNGPKRDPAFTISIPPSKEQAIEEINADTADIHILHTISFRKSHVASILTFNMQVVVAFLTQGVTQVTACHVVWLLLSHIADPTPLTILTAAMTIYEPLPG